MTRIQLLKTSALSTPNVRYFGRASVQNTPGWFNNQKDVSKQLEIRPQGREVYELLFEDVKPECWEKYLKHKGDVESLWKSSGIKTEVIGNWKYVSGDVTSRAVHLLKYPEGWRDIDITNKAMRRDPKFEEADNYGQTLITNQTTELLKSYRFWPLPEKCENDDKIYELSTYVIIPGSMYDWTNYWAKGLQCRQLIRQNIPYAGLFTQLGHLHTIYHIWCYNDFVDRNMCRKLTWEHPDWSGVVTDTGALITTMKSGILRPIPKG